MSTIKHVPLCKCIAGNTLLKLVNHMPGVVVSNVRYFLVSDYANPEIVIVVGLLKDRNGFVRFTFLGRDGSKGTVTNIDRSVISGCVTAERFGSFERMYVILEDCHDTVLIEVGNPME